MAGVSKADMEKNTEAIKALIEELRKETPSLERFQKLETQYEGEKSMRESKENWGVVEKNFARAKQKYAQYEAQAKTAYNVAKNLGQAITQNNELKKENSTILTRGTVALYRRVGAMTDWMRHLGKEAETQKEKREKHHEDMKADKEKYANLSLMGKALWHMQNTMKSFKLLWQGLIIPILMVVAAVGLISLAMSDFEAFTALGEWEQLASVIGGALALMYLFGSVIGAVLTAVTALVMLFTADLSPSIAAVVAIVGTLAGWFILFTSFAVGWPVYLGIAAVYLAAFIYNQRDLLIATAKKLWHDAKYALLNLPMFIIGLIKKVVQNSWVGSVLTLLGWKGGGELGGGTIRYDSGVNVTVYTTSSSPGMIGSEVGRNVDSALHTQNKRLGSGGSSMGAII
tara:strand:+ start:639 stop:1838 length:1200 start_codon:yes stop_codon:yes gene_type:complete